MWLSRNNYGVNNKQLSSIFCAHDFWELSTPHPNFLTTPAVYV